MRGKIFTIALCLCTLLFAGCHSTASSKEEKNLIAASEVNVQLGLGYLKAGQVARAKEKLLLSLDQNPRSAMAYSAMAYYWERTGENKSAEEYYLKALNLSSDEGELQNNYGTFLCRMKRFKEAKQFLLKAANNKAYINTAASYENVALCAKISGDDESAREYFMKTLEQDPMRERALYELALLEEKINLNEAAFGHMQRLLAITTPTPTLLLQAQRLANKVGDKAAVLRYQQQMYQLRKP